MSAVPINPTRAATISVARRTFAGMALLGVALGGCVVDQTRGRGEAGPVTDVPAVPAQAGPNIGTGSVKVALILPLTGTGQGALAGQSLRNAAELAFTEFQNPDLTILVKDDKGTPDGAREAATQAIAEGAELIIGPVFAPTVSAVGAIARAAGKPVIAFSTDTSVASNGVYLLSFTPQPEVERVIGYATQQGRRSFAALIPDTVYGNVVEAEFRESAARHGARVAAIERYTPGQPGPAVERVAAVIAGPSPQVDAILLPDSGEGLNTLGAALTAAGFDPARVKPLGTGVWNDPRTTRVPALQGGWYAAPSQAGFTAFAGRYRAKYDGEPVRLATLSYDVVSLAAALSRTQGSQRFSESALQSTAGFAGVDGTFRFKADGTNDRTLAVVEIKNGTTGIVSPAPRTLAGGT